MISFEPILNRPGYGCRDPKGTLTSVNVRQWVLPQREPQVISQAASKWSPS